MTSEQPPLGSALPQIVRTVTARDIIMGAAASRDWQPQHHDADHARSMNLPGVIMNTPTQTGWFHAYALQWAGEKARIGRWRLSMLRPICPGMEITISGTLSARTEAAPAGEWVWLDLTMSAGEDVRSTMRLLMHIPEQGSAHPSAPPDWPAL